MLSQAVLFDGVVDSLCQGYFQGISHLGRLGCEIHSIFQFEVFIHRNTVFISC